MRRSRERREVGPWHFWRRTFWTRAAFFVVLTVLMLGAAGGAVYVAVATQQDADLIHARRMCGAGVADDCLVRARGQVARAGYTSPRRVGPRWLFEQDGRIVDAFDVTFPDDARLAAVGADVSVLMLGDRVVVVELPEGDVTASSDSERGVWFFVLLTPALLGVAFGTWRYARKKRRSTGSWWAVNGPEPDTSDIPAFLAAMIPLAVAVVVVLGADWRLTVALAVLMLGLGGWWQMRQGADLREPDLPGLTRRR